MATIARIGQKAMSFGSLKPSQTILPFEHFLGWERKGKHSSQLTSDSFEENG